MWHHVSLTPLFHSSYAVVLAFLVGVLVLRRVYRPRAHWLFRPLAIGGALLAAGAELVWEFSTMWSGASTVLVGAAITTLALYGEVAMAMKRDARGA
ncbi:MAG TPA: hypothetical protein VLT45_27570 [Kofleriaceae bacterium]|nr:hypothetical protein [Kofleriaceae bacterium]